MIAAALLIPFEARELSGTIGLAGEHGSGKRIFLFCLTSRVVGWAHVNSSSANRLGNREVLIALRLPVCSSGLSIVFIGGQHASC